MTFADKLLKHARQCPDCKAPRACATRNRLIRLTLKERHG